MHANEEHHQDCGCKRCAASHVPFDPRDHAPECPCPDCCPENPYNCDPFPEEPEEEP